MTLGEICQSVLKVSSACKRKDSFPCQNKNKASRLHGVQMIFLPPNNTTLILLIFVLLSALRISRKAVWSHLEFDFLYVTWNGNTGCLGVWKEERGATIEQAFFLVSFARPHHKEANELLSRASSEGCNDSVRSTGAQGSGPLAPPARDGWYWWRRNTHILPEYEQQICQCVTGWQPRSQLLVHCCYISTLSKYSAKRQSASSSRGRQVAS